MTGYIYSLDDKDENDIFYIGSSVNTKYRFSIHRNTFGYNIITDIVEQVDFEYRWQLFDIETYWIDQFRQWGFDLKNRLTYKPFRKATNEIIEYIQKIQLKKFPNNILTNKTFDMTLWEIVKEHKELIDNKIK